MKIVYLIGNGFDLNLGLKTKYTDFYKKYINKPSSTEQITKLKKEFEKELADDKINKWSDFEKEFGQYSQNFENVQDYLALYYDIHNEMSKYMKRQNKNYNLTELDKENLKKDLFNFERHFNAKDKQKYDEFKRQLDLRNNDANVINFNYTKNFENIYGFNFKEIIINDRSTSAGPMRDILRSVMHIHGTAKENMILAVYDVDQIAKESFRTEEDLQQSLIKKQLYDNIGNLYDEKSKQLIKQANVICIFGMSFGETDRGWWEEIIERLKKSNSMLIIFGKGTEVPNIRRFLNASDKNKIIRKLLSYAKLKEDEKQIIINKSIVCLDSQMFKITKKIKKSKTKT